LREPQIPLELEKKPKPAECRLCRESALADLGIFSVDIHVHAALRGKPQKTAEAEKHPPNGYLTPRAVQARILSTLKYAILYSMRKTRTNWMKWAERFQHYKLDGLVAWLLEAGDPFRILGVQFLYMGQPFLGNDRIGQLANFLEDQDQVHAFTALLRKE